MKKLLSLAFLCAVSIFFSCNNNNPVTPTNPGSFQGEWTVDKVQMVSAPSGGGISAMMKQALVPFGEVDGSFAGYMDVKFGAETIAATSTNLGSGQSYFVGNTGYYIDNDNLYISSDGGNSWNRINFPISFSLRETFIKDANTVYVTGYNSSNHLLMKSSNQGVSWVTLNSNMNIEFSGGYMNKTFCFVNNTTGYAISNWSSSNPTLYKTTDEGLTWNIAYNFQPYQYILEMNFFSETNALIVTYDIPPSSHYKRIFLKTNDGGQTWNSTYSPSDFYVQGYFLLNENSSWIWGFNKEGKYCLSKSNNGAQTWNAVNNKTPFYTLTFANENTGYGITFDDFWVKTTDGGTSWATYSIPSDFSAGYVDLFNEQPVCYYDNKFWKPSGIIDTTKWTASGMITNSAVQLITNALPFELRSNGDFYTDSNNIVFTAYNYQNTHNKVGLGEFSFENNYLNIELNLPNDEKWKVKLRRK